MPAEPIYLLAFDHRGSFQKKLLGIVGTPTPAEEAHIREAKGVTFTGFRKALERGVPHEGAGILVDEQFGAEIARAAHEAIVLLHQGWAYYVFRARVTGEEAPSSPVELLAGKTSDSTPT